MARAYSQDLRDRVIDAALAGTRVSANAEPSPCRSAGLVSLSGLACAKPLKSIVG